MLRHQNHIWKIWYVTWEYATSRSHIFKYIPICSIFHIKVISVTFGQFCGQMLKKFVKALLLCTFIFLVYVYCVNFLIFFLQPVKKTRKTYLSGQWFHTEAGKGSVAPPSRWEKKWMSRSIRLSDIETQKQNFTFLEGHSHLVIVRHIKTYHDETLHT